MTRAQSAGRIDRLEFDNNRTTGSNDSRNSHRSLLDDDVSFMNEVAEGVIERDRIRMKKEATRTLSFVCAVLIWYMTSFHVEMSSSSITVFAQDR
jgi:hypothetical protein